MSAFRLRWPWPVSGAARVRRAAPGDERFLAGAKAAQVIDGAPAVALTLWLLLAIVGFTFAWAYQAKVDQITRAEAKVIPDGREQIISSLEGGILRTLLVKEGMLVEQGQALVRLDPTRVEALQNEGQAKTLALKAAIVRLTAEASGKSLEFPEEVAAVPALVQGETDAFNARRQLLNEAVAVNRHSLGLLMREVAMAERMADKGVLSNVEVMRLRRQANDLLLQVQDRINRFRQEASSELVRVQTELAQLQEQMIVKQDVLSRTLIRSPIRGQVKHIRLGTVGGVIQPGAAIMEIVPVSEQVLVEARIKPADIGFVRLGMPVQVKLSAYDFYTYGGLKGRLDYLSPDALSDEPKSANQDNSYYRALIRADATELKKAGQPLPVIPGMTGTVEVRTGEQTVLSYVFRPLLKSREAFTER
ncbi:HlyD family type I secretion periplasmic adaptor subunit [Aquabacterium lacunae]|uniref:Membrane fusion protein (MFP) family protein n=1 Tax=Aquabacterium lacunae TaxID=2528630 RepID=A0A4Q9H4X7_9BURK|nr:HlyD family type I secretion periplasmic adaptor subunit [Aquabacterium lacunae]TBO32590.1 HlyD family type I secretion periplasmic adaptor subunit [Aquabacterium lacunae]